MGLCIGNYHKSYGLVNGVDETFEECMNIVSKPLMWINVCNLHIGFNTMLEKSHIYKEFLALHQLNKRLLKYKYVTTHLTLSQESNFLSN
jgi:hypothetical protein